MPSFKRLRGTKLGRLSVQPAFKKRRTTNGGYKATTKIRMPAKSRKGFTRTIGYYGRYGPGSVEKKFFDGTQANVSSANNGTILQAGSLINISQGVGEQQRIGRKCVIKSIHFKGARTLPANLFSNDASDRMRIIVYQDKQCNGISASVGNMLQETDIDSFRNLENSGRFVFLYDRTHSIQATAGGGNGTNDFTSDVIKHWKLNINLNIPIEYNSTTGAIAEIRSNNIGIMMIPGLNNISGFEFRWRVRFVG